MVASHEPAAPSAEIDTSAPHEARVYNYWLDGKDNYAVDRELGDAIAAEIPTIRTMAQANRAFMRRAVTCLAREAGIRQFLDIGTGIPVPGNLHEVAQNITPSSRVAYVDNDPIVLAHARALLSSDPAGKTAYLQADVRDPEAVLDDPNVRETLNLDEPVGLVLVAILMYFRDADDPHAIIARLLDALPSGSHLVLSHPTADFDPAAMAGVVAASERSGITLVPRSREEIRRFLDGLEPVAPGIVPVQDWRPDIEPTTEHDAYYWAAMARKPESSSHVVR